MQAAKLSSSFLGTQQKLTFTAAPLPNPNATRIVTTCAKKKGVRCIVTLECTEARAAGETPSRYTTQKNRKNTAARLELMKYNKFMRKMTLHKEVK